MEPASSPQTIEVPVSTAISDGLLTLLTPMIDKCDTGIQQALDSQVLLSQQIDRVATEIQGFLSASQLPSFAPHAHRLADVRRRSAVAMQTLQQVQSRLSRIEAIADKLQAEEVHLQRSPPPSRTPPPLSERG